MSEKGKRNKLPEHIGIIMDGNGRWAEQKNLERTQGHKVGSERLIEVIEKSYEIGIPYLTVFCFSPENFSRPEKELDTLFKLNNEFFKDLKKTLKKHKGCIEINKIGSEKIYPLQGSFEENSSKFKKMKNYQLEILKQIKKKSKTESKLKVNFAINYGSRLEIIEAIQKYFSAIKKGVEAIEKLDWNILSKYLYTANIPDPDLIIRTSGEIRLSNFLMLQSAYCELYFTPTFWPDFDSNEFLKAIEYYQRKDRRFGNIKN